ncbi:TetR/AcrR family transcriptional regulator [Rhizobium sp. AAP43]|uniref:TetR/AcrR family transcriptional regulator n=1 Tax=Rhizobium sp. AAP43 TaxID=1523420 RepID=UPI0006B97EFE|nr:TetR/AcrR family transcriptional regulator [Rhizobium sp. AAP43]KPF43713.1 TetR family transcriptional regulator [Rhizobium sp. AAP43]
MKLRQERSRQTREQILEAARALFLTAGFDDTSIEQVAARAGVAKASIFAHFGDKTNLLAALGIARIEELLVESRSLCGHDHDAPLAAQLFHVFEPWLAYFGEDTAFARLYLSQSGLSGGPWTERFVGVCQELERLVAAVIADRLPHCTAERSLLLSRGLQALFHEVIVYRLSGWVPDHAESSNMLRQFITIWLAGANAAL